MTVHLTYPITMVEASAIIEWLNANAEYEFTGQGMELLTFKNVEDATAFKLRFHV